MYQLLKSDTNRVLRNRMVKYHSIILNSVRLSYIHLRFSETVTYDQMM
jgi:hypothetical protein